MLHCFILYLKWISSNYLIIIGFTLLYKHWPFKEIDNKAETIYWAGLTNAEMWMGMSSGLRNSHVIKPSVVGQIAIFKASFGGGGLVLGYKS